MPRWVVNDGADVSAPESRRPLDPTAYGLMLILCACWGLQQVAVKVATVGISPLLQGGIRSIVATSLLVGWIAARRIPVFTRDGTLGAGLIAGALFAAEFMFIYAGLGYTTASRMVVFVYLAPVVTALGVHWLVPGERLKPAQWVGVTLAFAGIVVAFGDGFWSSASSAVSTAGSIAASTTAASTAASATAASTLLGDAFGVIAAILWAVTTLVIRATRLGHASAEKTLLYQLGISAIALPMASFAFGERGITHMTPLIVASMIYQSAVVAFASYLAWFWLLTRYLAGRLSVFAFMTPLFGVLFGIVLLGEHVSALFAVAAVMVGAGIALVNRK